MLRMKLIGNTSLINLINLYINYVLVWVAGFSEK